MTIFKFKCSVPVLVFVTAFVWAQQPQSQNDQQPTPPRKGPIKIDPAYQKLANQTGGQVYVLDRDNPAQLGAVMEAGMGPHRQLLNTHGQLAGERAFDAVVGGKESQLMVIATGVTSLEIKRPTGSLVVANGIDTIYTKLGNGGMYIINNPEGGTWSTVLNGVGSYSLIVSAALPKGVSADSPVKTSQPLEDIDFYAFDFQEVAGRPGHEGLFKIPGYPVAGKTYPVEARMSGDFSTVRFEFRNADNQVLQSLRLKRQLSEDDENDRTYEGEVKIPNMPFRIYASGLDMHGQRYQRVIPQLVSPQSFIVNGPGYMEWQTGQSPACIFTVVNFGDAGRFTATIIDTAKYLASPRSVSLDLGTGESKQFEASFHVPIDAALRDTVVVTVVRDGDPTATNHVVVDPIILPSR
jgi:hypothetical protein